MSEIDPTLTFDQLLRRLDDIVRSLEKGEASLEDSLAMYTEGAELIRICTARLNDAEQTVMRVQKGSDGSPQEVPFSGEDTT